MECKYYASDILGVPAASFQIGGGPKILNGFQPHISRYRFQVVIIQNTFQTDRQTQIIVRVALLFILPGSK